MANQDNKTPLAERMLQAVITKLINDKLGSFVKELNDLSKGMCLTESESREARIIAIEMMKHGFNEFYSRLKARNERMNEEK